MRRFAVIVDPLSTGQDYAEAFREAGRTPVAVLAGRDVPPAYVPSWHPERFEHVHVFDGDLEKLAGDLRAYEPEYVVAGAESGVELADALAALLAPTTGNVPELAPARRDKWAMVHALARAGVPHLRQLCTSDPEAVVRWLRETGLEGERIVLKPPKSAGTDNVHVIGPGGDWRAAFEQILGTENVFLQRNEAVLVSEFADGTEFLVDTYSVDGCHGLVDVCRYGKVTRGDRLGIYDCVEFLPSDDPDVAAVWPYTQLVLDAVGIRNGCGHVEVMLTPSGPRLIEIGARPAGGGHQALCEVATGDNQIRRTVAHRARGRFTPGYQLRRHVRAVFISAPATGVWRNAEIFDGVEALPSFHSKNFPHRMGEVVEQTTSLFTFLAWVILASDDREAIEGDYRQLKEWEGLIHVAAA